MNETFYERYRYPLLAAVVCLAPLVALGASQAMRSNANDVRTWLPQGLPETTDYANFGRHFGTEEFVAVSWEGCTLDDPRLPQLAERLTAEDASAESKLVESVLTGPKALAELTSAPLNVPRDEALARLRGFAIGPDGRQSCAVVRPTERGKQDPHALLEFVEQTAELCGVAHGELRMGGPLVTSVAVDEEANASLNLLSMISIAAAFAFSWFCFRSVRLTLLVIAVGVFSAGAALAAVWYCGGQMNAVLVSMPPLVYVATTSGAIHWANYYRESVAEGGTAGAPSRAVAHARLPLALATGTTSLGLLSLCASDLLPIRQFGLYSAIGILMSLVWLLVVLPAGCAMWPLRSRATAWSSKQCPQTGQALLEDKQWHTPPPPGMSLVKNWWSWGQHVASRNITITVAGLVLAAACGYGLTRIKTTVTAEEFFPDDAAYPRDCRWLEERLGGIVPLELVLHMDPACELNLLERMELVDRVQHRLASLEEVGTSISAVTFGPPLPASDKWSIKRSVINVRLERHRDELMQGGFLATEEGAELWRISVRTKSFHHVDQRYFIETIRKHVQPVLDAQRGGNHITATFTGMAPLIERSQQSLLEGLVFGLVTDVVLIVLAIVVLMRHWSVGLVLLLTSVFPVAIVLGLMGWLGIALNIGSVLAPSVALGVTVDDVMHFVLWFRRGLGQGLDRAQSVRLAYRGCAQAMYQSWGVIGVGLSIFALSDFTPTRRFGLLMVSLLSVGLIANLVLLPALLSGPLGGFLARGVQTTKACRREPRPEACPEPCS